MKIGGTICDLISLVTHHLNLIAINEILKIEQLYPRWNIEHQTNIDI